MAKTRREFTPEFKREAVALLEASGWPQMQIATELGIQPSMLRQWRATVAGNRERVCLPSTFGRIAAGFTDEPCRVPVGPGCRDRPTAPRA